MNKRTPSSIEWHEPSFKLLRYRFTFDMHQTQMFIDVFSLRIGGNIPGKGNISFMQNIFHLFPLLRTRLRDYKLKVNERNHAN